MVRVIQITDPHIIAPPKRLSAQIDSIQMLQDAISHIKADLHKIGPIDAVLITGDISDDGSAESYALFRDLIGPLNLPYFVIPGNHDQREPMRKAFADQSYVPDSGRLNWSLNLKGLHVIGLDTLIEGQGGGILDTKTFEFLAQALAVAGREPALIAMHHPPFACGTHFMDTIGLAGIDHLRDILNASKADIRIVCGHVHSMMIGAVGQTTAISGPATCSTFASDFRPDAPVGFMTGSGGYIIHDWDGSFRSIHVAATQGSGPHPF